MILTDYLICYGMLSALFSLRSFSTASTEMSASWLVIRVSPNVEPSRLANVL